MIDTGMDETGSDQGFLRAEFEKMREELASIRTLLATEAKEHLSSARAAAGSRLAGLQEEVEKLASDVKGQGTEVLHEIDRKVQERPLTSLAVAFGVGLLAAQLFRR